MQMTSNPSATRNKTSVVWSFVSGLLLFSVITAAAWVFAPLNVDVHHQGIMYSAAIKVLDGEKIYGDRSYYYGPLIPVVNAFGLLLFGRKLMVLQAMGCLVYGLTAVALWRV